MDQAEEYVKRMLKVLVYIDEHLDDELTMEALAKVASYSPFHFHRIFQAVTGETVHRYVKRLRLQAAGKRESCPSWQEIRRRFFDCEFLTTHLARVRKFFGYYVPLSFS